MASASVSSAARCSERKNPKDLTADDVAEAYRSIAVHAALVSGTIAGSPTGDCKDVRNIRTQWSQRDIDRKEKTRFTKTYTVQMETGNNGKLSYIGCTLPQEVDNVLWDVVSPSEKKRVVILKKKDKKGEDKQYIELWNLNNKVKTINVTALDKHGDIVGNDAQFGSVQWSKCEEYLLYVAEKKKPKTASFFETKPLKDDDKDKGDSTDDTIKGGEYLHQETWGEQLVERHQTVICRLNVNTSMITLLTQVPDKFSPGQALWGPDNEVVFVVWCQKPFRLGLRFCVERKSFVCKARFDGEEFEVLSEKNRAVRCPSFSPDQSRLVYLDTQNGGPHNQCSRLVMIDWKKWATAANKDEARQVIVDIVNSPYKTGYDPGKQEFPGLYTWADLGTQNNWLEDGVHVVLTSFCRTRSSIVLINTNTKDVRFLYPFDKYPFRDPPVPPANRPTIRLSSQQQSGVSTSNDGFDWSCSLLDVRGNDVLLSCSWPDKPHFLVLGHLKPDGTEASQWIQLGECEEDQAVSKLFNWQLFALDPRTMQAAHPTHDYLGCEALLYLPVTDAKPPLVLFPHGGPHSSFDCGFALGPAVFARCGFAVLCVNYRGSLGFGQDSINSLLGHVGDFDVKDCMLAAKQVRDLNLVDPKNMFAYGGSHGGFLSSHLIGQYPEEFRATSMRNPVVNLTSMVGTSDIHDWVFVEAGLQFEFDRLASGDLLALLWKASPVSFIDNVKAPVMMHIGLKDLRVPPSQGLEYVKLLKARNVPVQCHTYPESNHSLGEVDVEADSLVNSILWFSKHLSSE